MTLWNQPISYGAPGSNLFRLTGLFSLTGLLSRFNLGSPQTWTSRFLNRAR